MRKIPYLVIISLLIFSGFGPITSVIAGEPASSQGTGGVDYENFSELPTGSFPANSDLFNFSVIHASQDANISVRAGTLGKGLNINADSAANLSDLTLFGISSKFSGNMVMRLTFSWNQNNNFAETGNQIMITNNNVTLSSIRFGPEYNYSLYFNTPSGIVELPEPKYSEFISLEVFFSSGLNNETMVSASYGYSHFDAMPVPIRLISPLSGGHIGLVFGGAVVNMTIYNVSVASEVTFGSFPGYAESSYFPSQEPLNLSSATNLSDPVMDPYRADIIFVNATNRISWYNLNNGASGVLATFDGPFRGVSYYTNSCYAVYVFYGQDGAKVYEINLTTGNVVNLSLEGSFSSFPFVVQGNNLYWVSGGYIYVLNLSDNVTVSKLIGINATLLGLSTEGIDDVSAIMYIPSNQTLAEILIGKTGTISEEYTSASSIFLTSVDIVNDTGVAGFMDIYGSYVLFTANLDWIFSSQPALGKSSSGMYSLSNSNSIYYLNGSGWQGSIFPSGTEKFFLINSTLAVAEIDGGYFLLWNGSAPYSDYPIEIHLNLMKYYSGKAFISANVSSKAPFKAYASVDGVPVSFSNGTILVNTSHFPNGTNTLTINAVNSEGNEITSSFKVAFDNYVVRIETNFVNGSSIPEGKNLNFSIGGVPNCTSTLQVQSFRYVFNSLSFTVKLPQNLNGTIQINVVVSDPLGRQFSRTYDLEILNNPFPNDFIYPINGSYFDTGRIHLSWGSEPNASLYRLVFNSSSGGAFSIQTGQNSTFANLTNGLWNIELMVTQDDNVTSSVGNLTVGVITYKPYLELYYNGPRNLSFFGNSNRTDAVVSIVTNITCYLNLSIIGPEGEVFHYESAGDFSNISLASLTEDFTRNGEYEILATAQTESGTFSEKNISFSVNNTIPGSIGIPTTYYTNSDTFTLLLPHSWNYSLKIANARNLNASRAILENDSVLINFTANLSTAEIEVLYTDSWGNHNSTWINITHSTIRPYIVLSADSIFLDKANETYLEYNVTDPERLGNISLLLDGKFYRNLSRDGGSVNISFKSNGNYSFRIFAADICGNTNYSPILNMTVDYYVKVSSVEIDAFMVLGFAYFHVIISGNNTNVLNVTVLSGGREVHSGASYFTILMPGFHTITFRISGNNYRSTITRDYFTVGFLPLLMPAGFVIYIVTRRRANIGKGRHIIVETILRNNGRSVDEIADLITEFKVTKRVLLKIARSMQRDGILELRTDLDGEFYVFTKESH